MKLEERTKRAKWKKFKVQGAKVQVFYSQIKPQKDD